MPSFSLRPTLDAAKDAVSRIRDVFSDFPFVGGMQGASFPNLLGLLLTPVCRMLIDGPTPLALIDAPKAGTGKGLLTDLVAIISTGNDRASMTIAPTNEEEWEKKITSLLSTGPALIIFDNVRSRLDSAALAAALTMTEWSGRLLGVSKIVKLPQFATWIANGNNINLAGDIARRCYRIRLDCQTARPYARTGFKIENLREHVRIHRGELLAALLTIVSAWFASGRPKTTVPKMGSFEAWSELIGSVVAFAGVDKFLSNLREVHDVDVEEIQWTAFLERSYEVTKGLPFTSKDLAAKIGADETLRNLLPDEIVNKEGDRTRLLGNAFRDRRDTPFGDRNVTISKATGRDQGLDLWVIKISV
jgi:hypothetical protein